MASIHKTSKKMNEELLESELAQVANGVCHITLVKPGFGTFSESRQGQMTALVGDYPIRFHFQDGGNYAAIFMVADVAKIEVADQKNPSFGRVVRLKGPENYGNKLNPTAPITCSPSTANR